MKRHALIILILSVVVSTAAPQGTESGKIVGWGDKVVGVDLTSGFVAVAGGWGHSLGLKADGSIVAWGNNYYGQCNVPSPNSGFVAVAGGWGHSLGLKADGSIVAWGYNNRGQCNVPSPNSGFVAVAAGWVHSLGLKADGSIVAWGWNGDGQCNVPSPNSGFVAVAGGWYHSLGLKSDGSIVAWGAYNPVPSPNSGFVAVTAGAAHSLGLKADGSIVAWGDNGYGQCNVPSPNSGFVAVAAGEFHNLGLKADGSIVAWGDNKYGQCNIPSPNSGFVAIAAGLYHSLGLKADGSIVAWGNNWGGQCNVPSPNSSFVAVSVGGNGLIVNGYNGYSLGLKADGSIVAWGLNCSGQCDVPSPNSDFVAVAAGQLHSLGLKANGSIVAWGYNSQGQCDIPSPNTGFVAVAAGGYHSLGLKSDGSIVAWGYNNHGQCNVPSPNSGFVAVSAGTYHSLGLKADGSIVAWGYNGSGQCNIPSPNSGFVAVSAGAWHNLGLKADESIVAWGYNGSGQCNIPSPNSDFVAVSAGESHSLGLKVDGSIVGWGYNNFGQATPPAGNDYIAIAAGFYESLALRGSILPTGLKIRFLLPSRIGNTGSALLEIRGSGFVPGAAVKLVQGDTQLEPNEVTYCSFFKLTGRFDLTAAPIGKYDVVVTNPGGQSVTLPQGLEIIEGGEPNLWTKLTVPPEVRPGRSYTVYIEYGNDGEVSMPIPIFHISNSGEASMQIGRYGRQSSIGLTLLGVGPEGFRTTLLPGHKAAIPITFVAPNTNSVEFHLTAYVPDNNAFPWEDFEAIVRPPYMTDEEWDPEWTVLMSEMGLTWQQVMDSLSPFLAELPDTDVEVSADFIGLSSFAMWVHNLPPGGAYGNFDPVNDVNIIEDRLNSANTCTYVITHGWRGSAGDTEIDALAQKILAHCPSCNVLRVNWQKGAATVLTNPRGAAENAKAAAPEAYRQLAAKLGPSLGSNVTFIGYSDGSITNNDISRFAGSSAYGIILSPPNVSGGGLQEYSGFGHSDAYFSDSILTDAGVCWGWFWPFSRNRIVDGGQFRVPSSPFIDGHVEPLRHLTNQIPIPEPGMTGDCSNAWLNGTLADSVPQAGTGWYDGTVDDDGQLIGPALSACAEPNDFNVPGDQVASAQSTVIRPIDPSEKRGTIGYDPCGTPDELRQHFVHPGEPLAYTVFFENEPNATAPAQEVRIVDYLNPCLDWTTLELGEIVFGDQVVTTLAGNVSGQTTVPLPDSNYVVDVNVQFNVYTGRMSWVLRTIDPNTGDLPENPQAGFLPPNDANHRGEGHVSFTVYPQKDLLDARITNKATIFFDTEVPFDVNVWLNAIDGSPPTSSVLPLPPLSIPTRFEVQWSGDDGQGCGIAGYDIYVATNIEPNVPWILNTSETNAVFVGVPGNTYRFFCVAHDFLGNVEPAPVVPDAETTLRAIDFYFFARFANRWLENGCHSPLWCDGMDLNGSETVDLADMAILAANWLLDCTLDPDNPFCVPEE